MLSCCVVLCDIQSRCIVFCCSVQCCARCSVSIRVIRTLTCPLHLPISMQYFHRCFRTGMRIRSAIISAVYKKALRLSSAARQKSTVGEIVNLMSVDAQRFQDVTTYLHTLWSGPFQIALCLYFLYGAIGASAFAGLGVMILMIPVNAVIASRTRRLQKEQMGNKDSRIKLMNEILNGMKVIKLYAWENPYMGIISDIRKRELSVLKRASYYEAFSTFAWICTPFLVSMASFTAYSLSGNTLTANDAFVSLALFNLLQFPLAMLPMTIASVVEVSVAVQRLEKFLLADELDPSAVLRSSPGSEESERQRLDTTITSAMSLATIDDERKGGGEPGMVIEHGTFRWDPQSAQPVLSNLSIEAQHGSLVAIVGAVASGKSSVVSAMLGEMHKVSGTVRLSGSVAYVPQQAWIQNATLRDNITFGRPFDQALYDRVIKACALDPDIAILPAGDSTEIGEKGINLSGGQKQRVSLARAVYQNADVYVFDDPLSAVDAHVGRHIFDQVVGPRSMLRGKVRILVTNNLRFLPSVDFVYVMLGGTVSEKGSFDQLMKGRGELARLINEYSSDTLHEQSSVAEIAKPETPGAGKGAGMAQPLAAATTTATASDKSEKSTAAGDGKPKAGLIGEEKSETGSVKLAVFIAYARSVSFFISSVIMFSYVAAQGLSIGTNVWLSEWTSDASEDPVATDANTSMYLGVYAGLGIANAVFTMIASFVLAAGAITASRTLHQDMLQTIMRCPMSFFDTTPLGRVLNRFSKDVYTIDEAIPRALRSFLGTFFRVLSVIVVISYSTPIFMAAVIPLTVLYVFIQRYYVSTSRQLQRLDSVSRSPIYAHFGESINGAATIRAYQRQDEFIGKCEDLVDSNQVAYYPNISANRWLAVRLEFLGNLIILMSSLFAVVNRSSIDPGLVGLSVTYALNVTQSLNWMVRMSSDLETNIVSVERVKEYTELQVEAPPTIPGQEPERGWPERGEIEFCNYSVRYRKGLDLVLRDLTLKIRGGEKVGICGRTGAGKSSMTLALFRIVEADQGSIIIDGRTIAQMGLDDLRSHLTIIPQEPVLFSGTLRDNLDPFRQCTDTQLWQAIERAHLRGEVERMPKQLDAAIAEGGENLSVGQRQLVCLARALLRKTKILVLDEATAAVDLETDAKIQQTIRVEFAQCTVITIAHRLNTIIDYDRCV
jgi:ABC-type multidrug transport system fused ATPase/permease subunit